MKVTEKDFEAIIDALNLFYRPEDHGCHFDLGPEKTRQERVGWIIDNLSATARAILEQAATGSGERPDHPRAVPVSVH